MSVLGLGWHAGVGTQAELAVWGEYQGVKAHLVVLIEAECSE